MVAGLNGDGRGGAGVAESEGASGALGDLVAVGIVEAECADGVVAVEGDDGGRIGGRQCAQEIGGGAGGAGDAAIPVVRVIP